MRKRREIMAISFKERLLLWEQAQIREFESNRRKEAEHEQTTEKESI